MPNGHLANRQITSLIKEATGDAMSQHISSHGIDFVILKYSSFGIKPYESY